MRYSNHKTKAGIKLWGREDKEERVEQKDLPISASESEVRFKGDAKVLNIGSSKTREKTSWSELQKPTLLLVEKQFQEEISVCRPLFNSENPQSDNFK